jgi:hypothetical protein
MKNGQFSFQGEKEKQSQFLYLFCPGPTATTDSTQQIFFSL